MAKIAYSIRDKGREAMSQKAVELNQQYANEYRALQVKQSEASSWNQYMQAKLAEVQPKEADKIQQAAVAWRNGSDTYYGFMEGKIC